MTSKLPRDEPVAVIGGGIIGLAIGWQLVRRGRATVVFDCGQAGRAASWVAAGMLAPHSEVGFEEEDFLALGMESLSRYPEFLGELEADTNIAVELDERGTLIVGFDRDDAERLRRLFEFRQRLKLPVEWLGGSGAREIESLLSPRVTSAIWLPGDAQINNRTLVDALKAAFVRRGGELREHTRVTSLRHAGGRARAIVANDTEYPVSAVVVAAGCWSGAIEGVPDPLRPPVRPVKGQIVALGMPDTFGFRCVVRAPDVYLLPKDDGRLLVGATQEEMGFDDAPTAGPLMRLLERGWEAVPSIYDLPVQGFDVGLRPGSRDHMPIVGPTAIERLYYATGHHRHGILLAPLTAYAMRDLIADNHVADWIEATSPSRFAPPPPGGVGTGGGRRKVL